MTQSIKLLDVVALLEDMPEVGLLRGHVGTVVEYLALEVYEVEFNDNQGETYAMASIEAARLMVLKYEPGSRTVWS
jgi:hypothetical protein